MNKRVTNALWIIAAAIALVLAVNYEKTIDLVVRYVLIGDEITWNGYTIKIDNSKRVQWPYNEQSVYVISRSDRDTYVQFHVPPQRIDPKVVVADICKQEKCGGVSESTRQSGNRSVLKLDLAMGAQTGNRIQKFIFVEGSPIWIHYQGAESRYAEFDSMISDLVSKIAAAPKKE